MEVGSCLVGSSMENQNLLRGHGKPCSSPVASKGSTVAEDSGSSFDCNICLNFPVDPVVTLCGHLYCWPCIYKWLQVSGDNSPLGCCPVCKAPVTKDRLLPLYGSGANDSPANPRLPRRPQSQENGPEIAERPVHQVFYHDYYGGLSGVRGGVYLFPAETSVFDSMAGGVLKGIADSMLLWLFNNQEETSGRDQSHHHHHHHHHQRAYLPPASAGRARMREVQAQYLLNQLLSFLSLCAFLCFLLF